MLYLNKGNHISFDLPKNLINKILILAKDSKQTILLLLGSLILEWINQLEEFKEYNLLKISIGSPLDYKTYQFIQSILNKQNINNSHSFSEDFRTLTENLTSDYENEALKNLMEVKIVFHQNNAEIILYVTKDYFAGFHNPNILLTEFASYALNMLNNPHVPIKDLPLWSMNSISEVLKWSFGPSSNINYSKRLETIFSDKVAISPDNIAVIDNKISMSYYEINLISEKLAEKLKSYVSPGEVIAVCASRNVEFIIAIFAILKSYCSFLAIDPAIPTARIEEMLEIANTSFIINTIDNFYIPSRKSYLNFSQNHLNEYDFTVKDSGYINITPISNPLIDQNTAYVIFTSGSTGTPKAIPITHSDIALLVDGLHSDIYPKTTEPLSVGVIASFTFDASIQQIFGALLGGHSLYIFDDDIKRIPEELVNKIQDWKIELCDATPSHLRMMCSLDKTYYKKLSVKTWLIGGESFSIDLYKNFNQCFCYHDAKIYNVYGPAECCVDVAACEINEECLNFSQNSILIGSPMRNRIIQIVDANLSPIPAGIIGEICIFSNGITKGYLGNIVNINNVIECKPRKYLTGDLGYWAENGIIQLVGRKDNQVKLNGYRIELGEIEQNLRKCKGIRDSYVTVHKINSASLLCAYYIVHDQENINPEEIKEQMKNYCPDYMIPSIYYKLDFFPMNASGKVDINKLPNPFAEDKSAYPSWVYLHKAGKTLYHCWKKNLGIYPTQFNENFFGAGGDSLKAVFFVSELRRKGYILNLRDLIRYPVISNILDNIIIADHSIEETINDTDNDHPGYYKPTPIQLYFFRNQAEALHHFNFSILININNNVKTENVKNSIFNIAKNQVNLRSYVQNENDEFVIQIAPYDSWCSALVIREYDFSTLLTFEKELIELGNNLQSSLNIYEYPLLVIAIIRLPAETLLLFSCHHLLTDRVTMSIIVEELLDNINNDIKGLKLSNNKDIAQIHDWSKQLYSYSKQGVYKNEIELWNKALNTSHGRLPVSKNLSYRYLGEMSIKTMTLSLSLTESLKSSSYLSQEFTIKYILCASLFSALYKLIHNAKHLHIWFESHGRSDNLTNLDFTQTIGWFTSIYPLSVEPIDSLDPYDWLTVVKKAFNNIPNNGIGFGVLKEMDRVWKDNDEVNYPEISFNFLGEALEVEASKGKITKYDFGNSISKKYRFNHKIEINAVINNNLLEWVTLYHPHEVKDIVIEVLHNNIESFLAKLLNPTISKKAKS